LVAFPDPNSSAGVALPHDRVIMVGHCVGESPERNQYNRLYSSLHFDEWVDIPFEACDQYVYLYVLSNDAYPMGGTMVWIRKDTTVIRGHSQGGSEAIQGQFLTGAMTSGLTAGSMGTGNQGAEGRGRSGWYCGGSGWYCGGSGWYCGGSGWYCGGGR
jgi:hypothetical protein